VRRILAGAPGDYNAGVDRSKCIACLMAAVALVGCSRSQRPITVGSKTSTEQAILGEIVAQHIEKKLQTTVVRRLRMGGSLLLHQSLMAEQIDVYPEYTGAALTVILRLPPTPDQDVAQERLKRDYEALHLVWMAPLGCTGEFAMVVRGADARAHKIETLSDATQYKPGWSVGVAEEFMDRADGYAMLMRTYNLPVNGAPKLMPAAELYRALQKKEVGMVAGSATDELPAAADAKALRDDKGAFTPDRAGLAVRAAALDQNPGLRQALEQLIGKFSNQALRKLNHEVDGKHRRIPDVAKEFISQAGL
jgi:glycine betaine/choline ABC-type transport system substrate-binding protein